jgi:hypothetical protein
MKKILLALVASAGLAVAIGGSAEAVPGDKYGALAYDMNKGRYGFSYNYDADWKARNRALTECGWGGCKAYVSFRNGCGALATDNNQRIYGWGTSSDRSTAISRALYECKIRGGNCTLKVWSCNARN